MKYANRHIEDRKSFTHDRSQGLWRSNKESSAYSRCSSIMDVETALCQADVEKSGTGIRTADYPGWMPFFELNTTAMSCTGETGKDVQSLDQYSIKSTQTKDWTTWH